MTNQKINNKQLKFDNITDTDYPFSHSMLSGILPGGTAVVSSPGVAVLSSVAA